MQGTTGLTIEHAENAGESVVTAAKHKTTKQMPLIKYSVEILKMQDCSARYRVDVSLKTSIRKEFDECQEHHSK